ncbi:MAG: CoA-binding protein [bacterium]|nr:CoA-binding protein [bacterium]
MAVDFETIDELLQAATRQNRSALFENEAYALIRASGAVRVPRTGYVASGDSLSAAALDELDGRRVVLKIVGSGISHKSDRGGVVFVEKDHATVSAAIDELLEIDYGPDAGVRGVLVCEYFEHGGAGFGTELFVGIRSAREFGPIIAAGLGGIHTEYFAYHLRRGQNIVTALAFETTGQAFFEMFQRTVAYEVLSGRARGYEQIVSDENLVECFEAFVEMARHYCVPRTHSRPSILELEVNPFAFQDGYMVPLDGLCQIGTVAADPPSRPVQKIEQLLHPQSIAVVGASARGMNLGRVILANLAQSGFDKNRIVAIKKGVDRLEGVKCVGSVAEMTERVDLLVVAVGSPQVPDVVDDVLHHRVAESVILIPGGMGETDQGKTSERHLRYQIAHAHAEPDGGPVFLGGNCLGIQSRPGKFDTFFVPSDKMEKHWGSPGRRVALISQSGAYVITRMSNLETLDPAYAISVGNQVDLTVSDLLGYFADRDLADVYGIYVEGFRNRDGLAAARSVARLTEAGKDVIFYKAGRTAAGRSATAGHTASIAGDYNVCTAAMANAGALVAATFKEFEYLVEIASHLQDRRVAGTRIGAISNAGYETVGMADAVVGRSYQVSLPDLCGPCVGRFEEILAQHGLTDLVNLRNPLDLTPMANDDCHEACIRAMLDCLQVDAVVASFVPLTPAMKTTPEEMASGNSIVNRLAAVYADTDKPLVVVIDSGPLYDHLALKAREAGVPVFRSADSAVRSLGRYLYHKVGRPQEANARCAVGAC